MRHSADLHGSNTGSAISCYQSLPATTITIPSCVTTSACLNGDPLSYLQPERSNMFLGSRKLIRVAVMPGDDTVSLTTNLSIKATEVCVRDVVRSGIDRTVGESEVCNNVNYLVVG